MPMDKRNYKSEPAEHNNKSGPVIGDPFPAREECPGCGGRGYCQAPYQEQAAAVVVDREPPFL